MTWVWQQKTWPTFRWEQAAIAPLERKLLLASGTLVGAVRHLNEGTQDELRVQIIEREALETSAIEGEVLDRASVQSSIRQAFGLSVDGGRAGHRERGIAEMLTDLFRTVEEPLSHEMLFRWHRALLQGRTELEEVGRYRSHNEPMQIVSGPLGRRRVHYEAPPSSQVRTEMDRFLAGVTQRSDHGAALTAAGVAHLHFEAIHPFEDGNGRVGRAVAEKVLAQALGRPTLAALASAMERHQNEYYWELEQTNRSLEITRWLTWFSNIVLEAFEMSQRHVDFLISKTKFFDRHRGQLNARQEKVLNRMFREGPKGFEGGLSADNYLRITKTSRATASRDLSDLVAKGALIRTGNRRATRYFLAL